MTDVRELMVTHPLTVHERTPISECAQCMADEDIRHLPVVDDAGRLVGLLNDFDVRRAAPQAVAAELARPVPVRAFPTDRLGDVLGGQLARAEEAIVVTDDERRPVGILTEHDAVALAATVIPDEWRVDASTRPVTTIETTRPAGEARRAMDEGRFRHLVLVCDGRPVGAVSLRDLESAEVHPADDRTIGELFASHALHQVSPGARLVDAADLMVRHRIGCVPVVDEEDLLGITTRTDIIDTLLTVLQARAAEQ